MTATFSFLFLGTAGNLFRGSPKETLLRSKDKLQTTFDHPDLEETTTAEASRVTSDNLQNKSFEQAEELSAGSFSSQRFPSKNSGKKEKRRDCGSTAAQVWKALRRDPSGKTMQTVLSDVSPSLL